MCVAALTPPPSEGSGSLKSRDAGRTHKIALELPSSAAQLHDAAEVGTGLDFDAALATVPLGTSAGTATYWIHPDNLIELHVLLLQHMRVKYRSKPSGTSGDPTCSGQSGEAPASSHENTRYGHTEDNVGHIILDNIDCCIKRGSGCVVSETSLQNTAASIRYCASGEAIVLVREPTGCMSSGKSMSGPFQETKVKRKHLENILDPCVSSSSSPEPIGEVKEGSLMQNSYSGQDLESLRQWFVYHSKVRPLVDVQYRRTRLIGAENNATHGFWATLDRDITMKRNWQLSTTSKISPPETGGNEQTEAVRFPYAVLELRWEESKGNSLAKALDKSHLVSCLVLPTLLNKRTLTLFPRLNGSRAFH